jgi:hypothetical protein
MKKVDHSNAMDSKYNDAIINDPLLNRSKLWKIVI